MIVKAYPVADNTTGMLQRFEAMEMGTLLLERSNHSFPHAILLGAMWRDELLSKPVAANQRCIAAAGEHQAIIGSKQERHRHTPQHTRMYIEKNGLFKALYVDKVGILGRPKRCNFSQMQRACDELGIEVIFANSPQGKG